MSSSGSSPCVWWVSQNMRDSLVLNSTSLRGNLHIWVSTASLVGGFTSRSYSTSVRMWHSQYTGVRCVCCLPVGRPTLRLLVRSHGGRGADALGFRRISTSSERTGRLAHQSVVSGRLRTNVDPAGRPGSRPPAIDAPDAARSESDRTDCSCHPDHEMWPPGVPSLSLQQPQAMMLDPMQASTTRWGGTE